MTNSLRDTGRISGNSEYWTTALCIDVLGATHTHTCTQTHKYTHTNTHTWNAHTQTHPFYMFLPLHSTNNKTEVIAVIVRIFNQGLQRWKKIYIYA